MPLTPTSDAGHHYFATDNIYFYMNDGDQRVRCGITRLALEILEPELPPTKQGRIQAFKQHRTRIEQAAGAKFEHGVLEPEPYCPCEGDRFQSGDDKHSAAERGCTPRNQRVGGVATFPNKTNFESA